MTETEISRFWNEVQVLGDDECWPWLGNIDPFGSGRIQINKVSYRAHNLAWALTNNCEYPDKRVRVKHTCGVSICCNPKHLYRSSRGADAPEEFWASVNRKGDDDCWEWLGSYDPSGYAITRRNNKSYKAHRMAWEIANGRDLEKEECIHWSCGNRSCCNPKHLYIAGGIDEMIERFWSYVQKGADDECWEWQAALHHGYGLFWDNRVGRMIGAHRLAWEFTNGPIPESDEYHGLEVMHKCDNPPCCNPAHLQIGTHYENMRDMNDKGRCKCGNHGHFLYGHDHPQSKFTPEQVAAIRSSSGRKINDLAAEYGVHRSTIRMVLNGERYK